MKFQSRYAFSPQDTDYTSSYPGPSAMNPRGSGARGGGVGGYSDFSGIAGGGGGGGGGGSAMGSMCNMAPAISTNSLNCALGGGGGSGVGGGGVIHSSSSGVAELSGGDPGAVNGTNLIVNYLPQDMTDRELYALFRTCGPINTCRVMRDYKVPPTFLNLPRFSSPWIILMVSWSSVVFHCRLATVLVTLLLISLPSSMLKMQSNP